MSARPFPTQRDRLSPRSSGAVPGGAAGTALLRWDIRSHDCLVLATLDGELDIVTTPPLGGWLSPIVQSGHHVVLDLARISFCGAAGLSLFVQLHHNSETAGGSLRLAAPSAALRRVLGLTQLDSMLSTVPDVPGTFITFGRQGTEYRALDASWTNPVTTEPAVTQLLAAGGLRRYLEEVAAALGVPADAVDYEVSNTATGYLALTARHPAHPSRDLMLSWQDTDGWSLATEPTAPTEAAIPIAHLAGNVLPTPGAVARFTDHALTNQHTSSRR